MASRVPTCQAVAGPPAQNKQSKLNKIASLHLQRMKDQQDAPPASVDAVPDSQAPGATGPANAKPSVTVNITHGPNADAGATPDTGAKSKEKKAQMAKQREKGKAKGK